MEKNTLNNYLRVKLTLDHINMDINVFYGPKNIRKSLLLGDLEKYAHPFGRVMEAKFFI